MMLLLSMLATGAHAAEPIPYTQVGTWAEGALIFDLPKGFDVRVAQHIRITPSPLRIWQILTDVGGTYRVTDWFRVAVGVRGGAQDFVPGRLEPRLRLNADARVRGRLGPLLLTLRERYQFRVPLPDVRARHTVRSKGELAVDVSDLIRVFVAGEPYLRLGEDVAFDRLRAEGGLVFDLPDRVEVEAWYRLDEPMVENDPRAHVIGIGVSKELKR